MDCPSTLELAAAAAAAACRASVNHQSVSVPRLTSLSRPSSGREPDTRATGNSEDVDAAAAASILPPRPREDQTGHRSVGPAVSPAMESKKLLSSSLFGDFTSSAAAPHAQNGHDNDHLHPRGRSSVRPVSPAPSSRFSLRRVSHSMSTTSTSSAASSSSASSSSSSSSSGLSSDSSCVTRETFRGECARHRFIVWAAVKRNGCGRMTASDRLECPLFRCRRRFDNHEDMLKHLAECEHLSTCEYWCFEHMRPERFDDSKCKRCLGHPSKRKKMLVMAKSFFHSLGHKGKKGGANGADFTDEEPMLVPPPSYDSLSLNSSAGIELSGSEIAEIDSTEVTSLPSLSQPAVTPTVVDPQALLLPEAVNVPSLAPAQTDAMSAMQWQPTPPHAAPHVGHPVNPIPAISSNPVEVSQLFLDAMDTGDISPTRSLGGQRPSLSVNTLGLSQYRKIARPKPRPVPVPPRSKDLSPSSSVRSNASTMSTISSIISPASVWSHASTACSGFATHLTSPTGEPVSPGGLLHEDTFAEELDEFCNDDNNNNNICQLAPELLHELFSELPADFPETKMVPSDLASDHNLFTFDNTLSMDYSYATELVLPEEACTMDMPPPTSVLSAPPAAYVSHVLPVPQASSEIAQSVNAKGLPEVTAGLTTNVTADVSMARQSGAKSLADSAWEMLLEHVASSLEKSQHVTDNPLADRLRSLTPRETAATGLETLRRLLASEPPTSPIDSLCLIHVIYAISVVVYYDSDVPARCNQLYLQSLAFGNLLSEPEKSMYTSLAMAIWHPPNISKNEFKQGLLRQYASLRRTTSQKGKEHAVATDLNRHIPYQDDPMVSTAQSFLDELECSAILGPSSDSLAVLTSGIWEQHLQSVLVEPPTGTPFTVAANSVIFELAQTFSAATELSQQLKEVYQRVNTRTISSVRRLELELLQAGKTSLPSDVFLDTFRLFVGQRCDALYQQHGSGASQRSIFHDHDITLLNTIFSELDTSKNISDTAVTDDSPFAEFLNYDFLKSSDLVVSPSFDIDNEIFEFGDIEVVAEMAKRVPDPIDATSSSALHRSGSSSSTSSSSSSSSSSPSCSSSSSSRLPHQQQQQQERQKQKQEQEQVQEQEQQQQQPKTAANDCCDICGYRPKGDPQWFKGSMAKHKKLQHSDKPPQIYKCQYPGCNSQYKNRPDNLRQHQIDKNHFVDGEGAGRRPSKKRKANE